MSRTISRPGLRRSRGFTLVESMVAMVVISVGLLGIAAMYVEGLRSGRTSVYRTMATGLAADMADRIRANTAGGVAYGGAAADNNCVNGAADCTPAMVAADDIFWWQQSVTALLPGGEADITVVPGPVLTAYTITINWSEPGVEGPLQYALAVQM